MHRHSAWTALGVDPATQRSAEQLAAREGMSFGGLLQLLLAEHASSKEVSQEGSALRQQLVPLFQEIVAAIGTAARVLEESRAAFPQPALAAPPPKKAALPPEQAAPPPAEHDGNTPTFEELQDWLRRMEVKKTDSTGQSKVAELGRTLRRRTG